MDAALEAHATNTEWRKGCAYLGKLHSVWLELSFEGSAENLLRGEWEGEVKLAEEDLTGPVIEIEKLSFILPFTCVFMDWHPGSVQRAVVRNG